MDETTTIRLYDSVQGSYVFGIENWVKDSNLLINSGHGLNFDDYMVFMQYKHCKNDHYHAIVTETF